MKFRYHNPPIIEAVCEVHFETEVFLTQELIKSIGEVWRTSYPDQQVVEEQGFEFQVNLGVPATVKTNTLGSRLIAKSTDGKKIAQHSAQFMAVNQLAPYKGWSESFRADIISRLKESVSLSGFEKVKLVNLRYIDRINLPQRPIQWTDWLAFDIPVPKCIPTIGGQFQSHFQQQLEPGLGVLTNLVTLPPVDQEITSIMFDTTIVWRGSAHVNDCEHILDKVHAPHPDLFGHMLTAKTKTLLGIHEVV